MPSPEISEAARTITENLNEAMRFFGRARHNGEVQDYPGVSIVYCGLDYAAFNAAVLSDPIRGGDADLTARITTPARHFRERRLRWSYWYCDDYVGKPLLRRARSLLERQGLAELTTAPGMIAEELTPPCRDLPVIEVKPVTDAAGRAAFAHVTSATFDVPWPVCREIYGSELAWLGSFRGYIGSVNGIAVTTTAVVAVAGVAGIYSVGTLPAYRGRGYAEALMRRVLQEVERETGIRRTALQSTRSGYSLYTRLGYRPVTSYTVFMTD